MSPKISSARPVAFPKLSGKGLETFKEEMIEVILRQNVELIKNGPNAVPTLRINGQATEMKPLFEKFNTNSSFFSRGLTRGAVYFGCILYKLLHGSSLTLYQNGDFEKFTQFFAQWDIAIPKGEKSHFEKYAAELSLDYAHNSENKIVPTSISYHKKSYENVISENFTSRFSQGSVHERRRLLKEASHFITEIPFFDLLKASKMAPEDALASEFHAYFLSQIGKRDGFHQFLIDLNAIPVESLPEVFALFGLERWNAAAQQEITQYLNINNLFYSMPLMHLIQTIKWTNADSQLNLAKAFSMCDYLGEDILKQLVKMIENTPWTYEAQIFIARLFGSGKLSNRSADLSIIMAQSIGNIKWTNPNVQKYLAQFVAAYRRTEDAIFLKALAEAIGKIEWTDPFAQKELALAIYNGKFGQNTQVLLKLIESLKKIKWLDPKSSQVLSSMVRSGRFGSDPIVLNNLFQFVKEQWENSQPPQPVWLKLLLSDVFIKIEGALELHVQYIGQDPWGEEEQVNFANRLNDGVFGKNPAVLKQIAQKIGTLQWRPKAQVHLVRAIFAKQFGSDAEVLILLEQSLKTIQWTQQAQTEWIGSFIFPMVPFTNVTLISLLQLSSAIKWTPQAQISWTQQIGAKRFGQDAAVMLKLCEFLGTIEWIYSDAQEALCHNVIELKSLGEDPVVLTQLAKIVGKIKWATNAQHTLAMLLVYGSFGKDPVVLSELINSLGKINWRHPEARFYIAKVIEIPDPAGAGIKKRLYELSLSVRDQMREWVVEDPKSINGSIAMHLYCCKKKLKSTLDFDTVYTAQFYNPESFFSFANTQAQSAQVQEYFTAYNEFKAKLNDLGIEIEPSHHTFTYKKNNVSYFLIAENPLIEHIQNFVPWFSSHVFLDRISDESLQLYQMHNGEVTPAGKPTVAQDLSQFPIFIQEILVDYHESKNNPSLLFFDKFISLAHIVPAQSNENAAQGASSSIARNDFKFNAEEINQLTGMIHHCLTHEEIYSLSRLELKKKYNNYFHVLPRPNECLTDLKNRIMSEYCTSNNVLNLNALLFAAFSIGRLCSSAALGWHVEQDNSSNSALRTLSFSLFQELNEKIAHVNDEPWQAFKPILTEVLSLYPQDVCAYAIMSKVFSPYPEAVQTPVQKIISDFYAKPVVPQ